MAVGRVPARREVNAPAAGPGTAAAPDSRLPGAPGISTGRGRGRDPSGSPRARPSPTDYSRIRGECSKAVPLPPPAS